MFRGLHLAIAVCLAASIVSFDTAQANLPTDPVATTMGSGGWITPPATTQTDSDPNFILNLYDSVETVTQTVADIDVISGTARLDVDVPILIDRRRRVPGAPDLSGAVFGTGPDTFGGSYTESMEPLASGLDAFGSRRGNRTPGIGSVINGGDPNPTNPVPEPATVMLLASGMLSALTVWMIRRRNELESES